MHGLITDVNVQCQADVRWSEDKEFLKAFREVFVAARLRPADLDMWFLQDEHYFPCLLRGSTSVCFVHLLSEKRKVE